MSTYLNLLSFGAAEWGERSVPPADVSSLRAMGGDTRLCSVPICNFIVYINIQLKLTECLV